MCWVGAGRRTPHSRRKSSSELGQIADVDVIVDTAADLELDPSSQAVVEQNKVAARNLAVLQEWAARPLSGASKRITFHFWSRPTMIVGDDRVTAVEIERTMIDSNGYVVGRGGGTTLPADLVVRSVGYRGLPLADIPFDDSTGRVPHAEGRVIRDGEFSPDEYVTGWIKRGPTGVIGTNKSDAVETVTSLMADVRNGAVKTNGRSGDLDRLLAQRGIRPLGMPAWHRIDAAELKLGASHGRLRTTLAHRRAAARGRREGGLIMGFGGPSNGVWCDDASPGMVARLARLGFDWVCLDAQHGGYSRSEIIDAARSFRPGPPTSSSGSPPAILLPSVPRSTLVPVP